MCIKIQPWFEIWLLVPIFIIFVEVDHLFTTIHLIWVSDGTHLFPTLSNVRFHSRANCAAKSCAVWSFPACQCKQQGGGQPARSNGRAGHERSAALSDMYQSRNRPVDNCARYFRRKEISGIVHAAPNARRFGMAVYCEMHCGCLWLHAEQHAQLDSAARSGYKLLEWHLRQ